MGPIFEASVGNEKEHHREDIKEQEQSSITLKCISPILDEFSNSIAEEHLTLLWKKVFSGA